MWQPFPLRFLLQSGETEIPADGLAIRRTLSRERREISTSALPLLESFLWRSCGGANLAHEANRLLTAHIFQTKRSNPPKLCGCMKATCGNGPCRVLGARGPVSCPGLGLSSGLCCADDAVPVPRNSPGHSLFYLIICSNVSTLSQSLITSSCQLIHPLSPQKQQL